VTCAPLSSGRLRGQPRRDPLIKRTLGARHDPTSICPSSTRKGWSERGNRGIRGHRPGDRAYTSGRDTLDPVGPDSAVRCDTAAPPVPPSAPWSAGRPEASGASQRDPGLMIGGGQGEPASSMPASRDPTTTGSVEPPPPPAARKWSWPELMRHTFWVDVLACARCGGRMRVVATIEDPVVIRRILTHLGLPTEASAPRPPPSDLFDFDWS
jgi:hypothetical protein